MEMQNQFKGYQAKLVTGEVVWVMNRNSSNPVHYGMTLEGTPEEKRAKFETNLAKFSADAQAGKIVCITDMLCQAEQLHVEGR